MDIIKSAVDAKRLRYLGVDRTAGSLLPGRVELPPSPSSSRFAKYRSDIPHQYTSTVKNEYIYTYERASELEI